MGVCVCACSVCIYYYVCVKPCVYIILYIGMRYYGNYPACITTGSGKASSPDNWEVLYMYTEFTNWHFSLVASYNGDWLSAFDVFAERMQRGWPDCNYNIYRRVKVRD